MAEKQQHRAMTSLIGGLETGTGISSLGTPLRILLGFAPILILLRFGGFEWGTTTTIALRASILLTALLPCINWVTNFSASLSKRRFIDEWRGWTFFLATMILASGLALLRDGAEAAETVLGIAILFIALYAVIHGLFRSRRMEGRPALALGLSFSVIIALGTMFLFAAPRAGRPNQELSLIDALFTATSATCVTGLESVSTISVLSPFGQGIVLFLIQVGGLGIMTLGTFLVLSSGQRLAISDRAMIRDSLNVEGAGALGRILASIFGFTLTFELLGACCLYPYFADDAQPMFSAIFHAVSAFCNAGFALRTDGLACFAMSPTFNLIVMLLIIFGGLGFTVLLDLQGKLRAMMRSRKRYVLTLHSRLVLIVTAVLISVGTLGFYLLERNGVLADMTSFQSFGISLFHSVSTRTAGFAMVPFGTEDGLGQATRFFLMPLMLIGASPGSTGGGLKTVTFAILVLGVFAEMRRRQHAEILGRRIPDSLLRQAAAVAIMYMLTICVGVMALLLSDGDDFRFDQILFESISALGTVGYSVGVSASENLSDFGKLVLSFLMFVGRLGPLTLVLFVATNRKPAPLDYPEERVIIG